MLLQDLEIRYKIPPSVIGTKLLLKMGNLPFQTVTAYLFTLLPTLLLNDQPKRHSGVISHNLSCYTEQPQWLLIRPWVKRFFIYKDSHSVYTLHSLELIWWILMLFVSVVLTVSL
jgi:hypothetical protein